MAVVGVLVSLDSGVVRGGMSVSCCVCESLLAASSSHRPLVPSVSPSLVCVLLCLSSLMVSSFFSFPSVRCLSFSTASTFSGVVFLLSLSPLSSDVFSCDSSLSCSWVCWSLWDGLKD